MRLIFEVFVLLFVLYNGAESTDRQTMWVIGDPHIYSVLNKYQICNVKTASGSTKIFTSTNLTITGVFDVLDSANSSVIATTMKSVSISISDGTNTYVYAATDPAMALPVTVNKSSNSYSLVNFTDNSTWIYVTQLTSTSSASSVVIYDLNTNSTIMVYQRKGTTYNMYWLILRTSNTTAYTATTNDLFYTGCAAGDLYTPSGRRKRSTSENARTVTCSVSGSSDPSLDATTADSICEYDGQFDDDLANAVQTAVEAVSAARALDVAAFGAAGSNFILTAQFGLFVALFNLIFVFLNK